MFVFSCSCLVVRSHEVKDERYEIDQDSKARSWLMFVAVMAATLALSGEAMQVRETSEVGLTCLLQEFC
ncbi:hypothetical protein Tco_1371412 [Tanacetum coccineum]